jgi:hypothetical protein
LKVPHNIIVPKKRSFVWTEELESAGGELLSNTVEVLLGKLRFLQQIVKSVFETQAQNLYFLHKAYSCDGLKPSSRLDCQPLNNG